MIKLYDQIEYILKNNSDTRNSDIHLTIAIWKHWHEENLFYVNGELAVMLKDLYELPREDNIKRIRAKIQNEEHKYLPTEWKIAETRGFKEDEWRVLLGYTTKDFNKNNNIETKRQKDHLFPLSQVRRD